MSHDRRDVIEVDELFVQELRLRGIKQVLGGTLVVGKDFPSLMSLDANGATRIVTMPAEADVEGKLWLINNLTAATHALTVNDDESSPNLIVSIPATKSAIISVVAGVWRVYGVVA